MKFKRNKLKNFDVVQFGNILGDDLGSIDLGDSLGALPKSKNPLFLKRFSEKDLLDIMAKVGMIAHLEGRGFDDFKLSIDVDDAMVHYLKMYTREKEPDYLLMDLRLTETKFLPKKKFFIGGKDIPTYDMVVIEWLSAQNPVISFKEANTDSKPQLPGQAKPGLGILKYCFEMMYLVAQEVTKDGFLDVPDHMHGAIMYSKKFKFFDPVHEAILKAILRDMKDYSLVDISWGMLTNTIIDIYKDVPQAYDPSEQIFYVSSRMKRYFNSSGYKSLYNKYYRRKKYRFDYDEMLVRREEILRSKKIVDL